MKIYPSKTKPVVTIVACMHGDETFGLTVVDFFKDRLDQFPGLQLVIANEEAVAQNKRFIETDLNRSFPGNVNGSKEERLAVELFEVVRSSSYVLDIHNTTSDILMTPIVTGMDDQTKRIINLCSSKEIAYIQKPLSDKALGGQMQGCVSLEFVFAYAQTQQAKLDVENIIDGLLANESQIPKMREVFYIDGSIPKSKELPKQVKNFQYISTLGVYPFLLYERAYTNLHALSASKMNLERI